MKNENRKYYAAYEERYKVVHQKGVSWFGDKCSPIVLDIIKKYNKHTRIFSKELIVFLLSKLLNTSNR